MTKTDSKKSCNLCLIERNTLRFRTSSASDSLISNMPDTAVPKDNSNKRLQQMI